MIAIANPIKEEYKPVQNTSDIPIYLSLDKDMYHLSPAYFSDIRAILINRIPSLTDAEIEVIIDVFLTSH